MGSYPLTHEVVPVGRQVNGVVPVSLALSIGEGPEGDRGGEVEDETGQVRQARTQPTRKGQAYKFSCL